MAVTGSRERITAEVLTWEGMSAVPHRFGGTEYLFGTREIGHIHGDTMVDIPFPTKIRNELVAAGEAEPHHLLQDSGWVSFYIRQAEDVAKAVKLLERSYHLANRQRQRGVTKEEDQ
ncbi:MAG: DUF5519 family protein [Caldilineaceae bacterium]